MPSLEQRVSDLEARLAPAPPEAPIPKDARRKQLQELINGQRESVRIAEEGQTWVEAIASQAEGRIGGAEQILRAAQAALTEFSAEQVAEAGELLGGLWRGPEPRHVRALRRVHGATQTLEIVGQAAREARAAAEAHRKVTVDSAKARLAEYEAALATLA